MQTSSIDKNTKTSSSKTKDPKKISVLKMSIMQVVRQIPDGKVMFFGQIADMVNSHARVVGYILTGMTEEEMKLVPWYRVVAKDGYISSLKLGEKGHIQKQILNKEGYKLIGDKVDMNEHLWLFAGINHLEDKVDDYEGFIEGLKR